MKIGKILAGLMSLNFRSELGINEKKAWIQTGAADGGVKMSGISFLGTLWASWYQYSIVNTAATLSIAADHLCGGGETWDPHHKYAADKSARTA